MFSRTKGHRTESPLLHWVGPGNEMWWVGDGPLGTGKGAAHLGAPAPTLRSTGEQGDAGATFLQQEGPGAWVPERGRGRGHCCPNGAHIYLVLGY
ncbi:hypothetical protein XENTR_v10003300 [Xenopus tropicalis]|nr:hypothetical protein XENTR_v10003300 [Xenopus tropicalis]